MQIEYVKTETLVHYEKNAKEHTELQLEQIKRSILQFGMNDPIGVWKDNVVNEGHGRLMACKALGMEEVPIIRLEHLSDEERKAYTLAHNQLTMNTGWDFDILDEELESILDIDMEDFGFEFETEDEKELKHEIEKDKTQERIDNLLNLGIAQYKGVGMYDIPQLYPVQLDDIGDIEEWIGFNYVLSDENPEKKAVHFFLSDYQFERIWNNPEKYVEKLRRYKCVLSPDFSPYADMPMATQIYNHYRKHWVGRYMQDKGVIIVPTIRASADKRSYEWCFDGEPTNSVVCISSMWDNKSESEEERMSFINKMKEKLNPSHIFVYGNKIDCYKDKNVTYIKNFTNSRWG